MKNSEINGSFELTEAAKVKEIMGVVPVGSKVFWANGGGRIIVNKDKIIYSDLSKYKKGSTIFEEFLNQFIYKCTI